MSYNLERLLEVYETLGPIERKVLVIFANRIAAGQRHYGQLTPGKKVWTWEAFEEAIDKSVYLCCGLLDATEGAKIRQEEELKAQVHPTVAADMKRNPQFYQDRTMNYSDAEEDIRRSINERIANNH